MYFTEIKEKSDGIYFYLFEHAKLDAARIPDLVKYLQPHLSFAADPKRPHFIFRKEKAMSGTVRMIRDVLNAYQEICL